MILVSAPVPLGLFGSLNYLGLGYGFGGLGSNGLGPGLDNCDGMRNLQGNVYIFTCKSRIICAFVNFNYS